MRVLALTLWLEALVGVAVLYAAHPAPTMAGRVVQGVVLVLNGVIWGLLARTRP